MPPRLAGFVGWRSPNAGKNSFNARFYFSRHVNLFRSHRINPTVLLPECVSIRRIFGQFAPPRGKTAGLDFHPIAGVKAAHEALIQIRSGAGYLPWLSEQTGVGDAILTATTASSFHAGAADAPELSKSDSAQRELCGLSLHCPSEGEGTRVFVL